MIFYSLVHLIIFDPLFLVFSISPYISYIFSRKAFRFHGFAPMDGPQRGSSWRWTASSARSKRPPSWPSPRSWEVPKAKRGKTRLFRLGGKMDERWVSYLPNISEKWGFFWWLKFNLVDWFLWKGVKDWTWKNLVIVKHTVLISGNVSPTFW